MPSSSSAPRSRKINAPKNSDAQKESGLSHNAEKRKMLIANPRVKELRPLSTLK